MTGTTGATEGESSFEAALANATTANATTANAATANAAAGDTPGSAAAIVPSAPGGRAAAGPATPGDPDRATPDPQSSMTGSKPQLLPATPFDPAALRRDATTPGTARQRLAVGRSDVPSGAGPDQPAPQSSAGAAGANPTDPAPAPTQAPMTVLAATVFTKAGAPGTKDPGRRTTVQQGAAGAQPSSDAPQAGTAPHAVAPGPASTNLAPSPDRQDGAAVASSAIELSVSPQPTASPAATASPALAATTAAAGAVDAGPIAKPFHPATDIADLLAATASGLNVSAAGAAAATTSSNPDAALAGLAPQLATVAHALLAGLPALPTGVTGAFAAAAARPTPGMASSGVGNAAGVGNAIVQRTPALDRNGPAIVTTGSLNFEAPASTSPGQPVAERAATGTAAEPGIPGGLVSPAGAAVLHEGALASDPGTAGDTRAAADAGPVLSAAGEVPAPPGLGAPAAAALSMVPSAALQSGLDKLVRTNGPAPKDGIASAATGVDGNLQLQAGAMPAADAQRPAADPVAPAHAAGAPPAPHSALPSSLLDQVAPAVVSAARDGEAGSRTTLSITPDQLGKVTVSVERRSDGTMQIEVSAQHLATLDLLRKDQADLTQALDLAGAGQGSHSLSFSLASGGGHWSMQGEQQNGRPPQHFPAAYADDPAPAAAASVQARRTAAGSIDVTA